MARRTVGIDFGTSTTLIATREGESSPRVIPIGAVTSWMPSVIGLDGDRLVAGEAAVALGPARSLRSIKSLLTSGAQTALIGDEQISVRDGVRALVAEAITRAEADTPGLFEDAEVFVGCPALWTGIERRLLVDVLHECGINVDIGEVIDEPIAAGLHWVNDQWQKSGARLSGRSLIFDAGGGTLDVGYLDVSGIDEPSMTVLSSEGRAESGDVLDESIAEELLRRLAETPNEAVFHTLLREASRDLKERLSTDDAATFTLPAPFDVPLAFTRNELEAVFADQLDRAARLTKSALAGSLLRIEQPLTTIEIRAKLGEWSELAGEVDHVALVGGLAQVPVVRQRLSSLFPRSTVTLVDRPQESVVRGLTYGDRITELNLPRPPVDFYVSFADDEGPLDPEWLAANQLVYRAFSPLYNQDEIMNGTSLLGYEKEIPPLPGPRRRRNVTLRCVMPTRGRETLKVRYTSGAVNSSGTGITIPHNSSEPIRFKLYTNGEFVFTSSLRTEKARVERWPTLRGLGHDHLREIQLVKKESESVSQLAHDNWRFP